MRAAATDRDRTVEVLAAAYGEGRLTKEEFDERTEQALAAKTYADLSSIVGDLPGGSPVAVQPYRPGYFPPRRPTSGLAIASLVCALIPFPGMPIAAVICGHMARARIKRTGEGGDGMAIAGLVIGYLAIIAMALFLVGGIAMVSHAGGSGPVMGPRP